MWFSVQAILQLGCRNYCHFNVLQFLLKYQLSINGCTKNNLFYGSSIRYSLHTLDLADLIMESTSIKHNASSTLHLVTIGWDTETTKDTFMEEVESYAIFKIMNFINVYWFPFLIPRIISVQAILQLGYRNYCHFNVLQFLFK